MSVDTTDDILVTEAEYGQLLNDPRRPLSRFVEVSLAYGRMLADPDPQRAVEVLSLAVETLHDPPAPAEAPLALALLRALRPVCARLGLAAAELDTIVRERRLFDLGLAESRAGEREELCRRAAAVCFADGRVEAGFAELMDGLRFCSTTGLDDLATDLVLAVRRHHVPDGITNQVESLWIELRRQRFDGNWPLWCLTALGALRLDGGDVLTAQMYLRRAESILGHLQRPVAGALVGGWVALAAEDYPRAHDRFTFASAASTADDRIRLFAAAGLGEALVCLGRIDEARAPLAEAIAYDVGDPQSLARCHELLAEIAAADGRPADAYAHLQATRRLEQAARGETPATVRVTTPRPEGTAAPADDAREATAAETAGPDVVDLRDGQGAPPEPGAATHEPARGAAPRPHGAVAPQVDVSPAGIAAALVRDALADDRLELHFQPIVDNSIGRVGAAEALLRLHAADGAVVPAAEFLSALSDRDLIERLGSWTLDHACAASARWQCEGRHIAVVVNLAAMQLTGALPLLVRSALARTGARPDLLTVELDGAAASAIDASGIGLLDEVRATGARIGIDHFGGDFRSIDTLLRLPIDVVKLDRSVFGGGPPQPLERRMVDTVVALARAFGFEVIATGIETEPQLEMQLEFGCHGAQGYLLGQPVPEHELRQRLARVA